MSAVLHFPAFVVSLFLGLSMMPGTAMASPGKLLHRESPAPAPASTTPALAPVAVQDPSLFATSGTPAVMEKLPGLESYLEAHRGLAAGQLPGPGAVKERYPWRNGIVTTTFWVGEEASKRNPVHNHASSWDMQWAKNYGGFDDPNPKNRTDYIPANFTPRQNPFYIALPYNDVTRGTTKPEAPKVIPWFKEAFERPGRSVLKGRWVAVRFKDRIAYAQWEDCGPFRTDHWQYVFGDERPKANLNKGAGLDVSPAVRDYLGMKSTDVTDWRFVDFDEVPQGPWSRHGDNNTFVLNRRAAAEKEQQAKLEESRTQERTR